MKRIKGRSSKTYNNELVRLQKLYRRLSKGVKFAKKYPKFEDFLAKNPIRKPCSPDRVYKPSSAITPTSRGVWGN
jgi:hypothetical protein